MYRIVFTIRIISQVTSFFQLRFQLLESIGILIASMFQHFANTVLSVWLRSSLSLLTNEDFDYICFLINRLPFTFVGSSGSLFHFGNGNFSFFFRLFQLFHNLLHFSIQRLHFAFGLSNVKRITVDLIITIVQFTISSLSCTLVRHFQLCG
jgi:hypothetical protein